MPETAHQGLTDYPLPGPKEWKVDLFSAETGRILTELLGGFMGNPSGKLHPKQCRVEY